MTHSWPGRRVTRDVQTMIVAAAAWAAFASAAAAQVFPLADASGLAAGGAAIDAVDYRGRKAVRVTRKDEGVVLLPGTDFQDGTIEVDVAVKITTPPGVRMPGFLGVAFRARPDGSAYDLFYVRPRNARAEDQAMRNHAVQYVAAPDFGWYRLRREWPWVYEAHADLQTEAWIPLKIDVKGRRAALFVNGATEPALIVDGLKGPALRGAVALWSSPGEEAYFSNVRITPAPAQPVKNGGEAAGSWKVTCNTDAGMYEGTMTLRRDGSRVTGTWNGAFGSARAVTGTWRDGYVELTFPGDWPEKAMGQPGPITATLAGWIDEASANGRMKIDKRTDGIWTATRQP